MDELKILFLSENDAAEQLKYAVIAATYKDKLILCRHRDRTTWELPAGHIEPGESPSDAAKRELYEETGAADYNICSVCVFYVQKNEKSSYGMLYYAEVKTLAELPDMEIEEIKLCKSLPNNMTYPDIQPLLLEKAIKSCAQPQEPPHSIP